MAEVDRPSMWTNQSRRNKRLEKSRNKERYNLHFPSVFFTEVFSRIICCGHLRVRITYETVNFVTFIGILWAGHQLAARPIPVQEQSV
jgi:hypothetical protein